MLTVVAIVAALDVLPVGGLEVLSAARAYVGGESLWAKGQKESVAALRRYAETRDPSDYARYERAIAVPLGDHQRDDADASGTAAGQRGRRARRAPGWLNGSAHDRPAILVVGQEETI